MYFEQQRKWCTGNGKTATTASFQVVINNFVSMSSIKKLQLPIHAPALNPAPDYNKLKNRMTISTIATDTNKADRSLSNSSGMFSQCSGMTATSIRSNNKVTKINNKIQKHIRKYSVSIKYKRVSKTEKLICIQTRSWSERELTNIPPQKASQNVSYQPCKFYALY